ncbi:hypothetical protein [Rhodococcus qingshengii]|uniref:hypothetical protein n=1 Tax=Rhodococcus qingshengii TaxID=334542 RepID=UPI0036DE72B9
MNSAPTHTSTRPASWWAELIKLSEPTTKGARTVSTNFHELQRRGFITMTPSSTHGLPPTIDLLNETRTQEPYQLPYINREHYNRIPETLWTLGTIGELDGRALAMYLILIYYQREPDTWTWFSSESFQERHYLSDNIRTKGLNELVEAGVAQMQENRIQTSEGTAYRMTRRRSYQLLPNYCPPKTPRLETKKARTPDSLIFDQIKNSWPSNFDAESSGKYPRSTPDPNLPF